MPYKIILALFICGNPVIENETKVWNSSDEKVLKRARFVCRSRYNLCLKVLKKKKNGIYHAICGRPRLTPKRM
jgi:hypothetical protein